MYVSLDCTCSLRLKSSFFEKKFQPPVLLHSINKEKWFIWAFGTISITFPNRLLDWHYVCQSLDPTLGICSTFVKKSHDPSFFSSFFLSDLFTFMSFLLSFFPITSGGPGWTWTDPDGPSISSRQLVLAHLLILCFPF